MTATSLQFGPEWMRNKHSGSGHHNNSSTGAAGGGGNTATGGSIAGGGGGSKAGQGQGLLSSSPPVGVGVGAGAGASTYSSLLSSDSHNHALNAAYASANNSSIAAGGNPFKYSKEEMLQVWREGGGRGPLGLEVELWEGVVKEVGGEPVGIREMSDAEKKLFALPLNSELRRRQSHSDFLPTGERPKLTHSASSTLGQPRFSLLGRKKREDGGADVGPPLAIPRRLSLTSTSSPMGTPLSPTGAGLPSPRPRIGSGVLDGTPDSWRKREPVLPEERDEPGDVANGSFTDSDASRRSMAPSPPSVRGDDSGLGRRGEEISAAMNVLSVLDEGGQDAGVSAMTTHGGGVDTSALGTLYKSGVLATRPPGLEDPATINWSYRDPKGNVQGPFVASIMQKWYEEGYFTPDLLMKRTHLDTDWTPVGELAARADHEKLFYSTFLERSPPGLTSRPATQHLMDPMHGAYDRFSGTAHGLPGAPQHVSDPFGSPYRHPLASRGTLDSYIGTPSAATHSPLSTTFTSGMLGASPDLAYRNAQFSPGVNGFDAQASPLTHRPGSGFGNAAGEPPFGPRLASLRTGAFDNQGFNGYSPSSSSPWGTANNVGINHEYDNIRGPVNNGMFAGGYNVQGAYGQESYVGPNVGHSQPLSSVGAFDNAGGTQGGTGPLGTAGEVMDNGMPDGMFGNGGLVGQQGFGAPQQVQHIQQQQIPPTSFVQYNASPQAPGTPGPWDAPQEVPHTRPRPFDPPHPSTRNIISTPTTTEPSPLQVPAQPSEWDNIPEESTTPESIGIAPSEPERPAQNAWNTPPQATPSPVEQGVASPVSAPSPAPVASKKQKSADAATQAKAPTPIPAPATQMPSAPKIITPAPSAAPAKPAWGTVPSPDEVQAPKTTLREIQEAEAKRAEARKLAEQKEREKARAAAVNQAQEETQTFTASWGLPTSQVGTARSTPRDQSPLPATPAPAAPSALAAVWTNAAKPVVVKKTMKEIQEEEERKKKLALKEKESAAVAARRGYAESANKTVPVQPTGGAWTTVGAGGKTAAATVRQTAPQPVAAPPAAARSVNGTPTRPNIVSIASAPTPAQASKLPPAVRQAPAQPDDGSPPPPGPELMKWLRENTRDFNAGFNTDDFLQMILSFSLDFPQPIIELIQEQVYANSSTMNGNRFATEFVARRKADAANRPKLVGASGRQPSLAEVVKTQPKPVRAELPFKMVKKKGRK